MNDQTSSAVDRLSDLVRSAPISYHAAAKVAETAVAAGFALLDEREDWPDAPGAYVVVRDGAVIAWRRPESATALSPFAIIGAHTDSPGFRLKPVPDSVRAGWRTVNAEIYGGPLLNSWLDRDLRIAARLLLRDGLSILATTCPVARIPQLAIHLDRSVNSDGLRLDRQQHTHAVLGPADAPGARELLAAAAGVDIAEIAAMDAFLADAQPPELIGATGELLASPRLDNLVSVSAGLGALLAADDDQDRISVLAAFDHEEVGSGSRQGAAGPFLDDVLQRVRLGLGADAQRSRRALAASWCVSSDVGHSVHPNYPDRHDEDVRPRAGSGPILKINADQRYTTDGRGEALWRHCAERAAAPVQTFVSRNSLPCGSTIGPITATRLGIPTVDVGIPILSMHSARELAAVADLEALEATLLAFLREPWPVYRP